MSRFLLPCTCGRQLTVASNQAGERLRCECGQSVEVPTFRELSRLPRADDLPAVHPAASWSRRSGIIFLGAVIALLSLAAVAYLGIRRPRSQEEVLEKAPHVQIDKLTPALAWMYWQDISRGLGQPLPAVKAYVLERNQLDRNSWGSYLIAAAVLAGAGILLAVIGLLLPHGPPRPQAAGRPAKR